MFNKPQKWAAKTGIWAQIVLIVSFAVFGLVQGPHYSWLAHSISDMYADKAPLGSLLVAVITVCGAMTLMFVVFSLWPSVKRAGLSAKLATVLLGLSIFGVGDLLSPFERLGCRLADAGCTDSLQTATTGGRNDMILSGIGVFLLMIGVITLGYSISKLKEFKQVSKLLIYGGYLLILVIVIMGMAPVTIYGLMERLVALLGAVLLALLAKSCLRATK